MVQSLFQRLIAQCQGNTCYHLPSPYHNNEDTYVILGHSLQSSVSSFVVRQQICLRTSADCSSNVSQSFAVRGTMTSRLEHRGNPRQRIGKIHSRNRRINLSRHHLLRNFANRKDTEVVAYQWRYEVSTKDVEPFKRYDYEDYKDDNDSSDDDNSHLRFRNDIQPG